MNSAEEATMHSLGKEPAEPNSNGAGPGRLGAYVSLLSPSPLCLLQGGNFQKTSVLFPEAHFIQKSVCYK